MLLPFDQALCVVGDEHAAGSHEYIHARIGHARLAQSRRISPLPGFGYTVMPLALASSNTLSGAETSVTTVFVITGAL